MRCGYGSVSGECDDPLCEARLSGTIALNLLDQIDDRLKDPDFRLNRDDFEDCSTSLLTDIYPNLVPISGGSDEGRDAQIGDPDGTIGVLITSSRDLEGVLANLRKGCRQIAKKQVPIRRVILANLAELNASKRKKIAEASEALGFEVVQTYPRLRSVAELNFDNALPSHGDPLMQHASTMLLQLAEEHP